MTTEAEIKEKPVADWPGWTKLQAGSSRRYRSPGGVEISASRFMDLALKYKGTGMIPESVVGMTQSAGQKAKGFISSISGGKTISKNTVYKNQTNNQETNDQANQNQEVEFIPPEPKPHAGRSGGGRASPKELSDGLYISISIATSIVALLLREPQLAATELEAKNIAIPAANLLAKSKLNERFGRLIAESGDWQLLGYAIWMYFNRVFDVVKVKRENSGPKQNAPRTSAGNVPNTPASPNGAGAAPGGFISNGAKSPPGVTPTTFIRQ